MTDSPVRADLISVGVLTPHAEAGADAEFVDMAPGRLVTRVARIPAPGGTASAPGTPPTSPIGLRALTEPSVLDDAAAALSGGSVDVIAYASTSTGYAIGFDVEVALVERLSQRWGLPAAGTTSSAVAALRTLQVGRVALFHPPWFAAEMNELGRAYFRSQGFEVVTSESAELTNDPARIEPAAVVDWISRHVSDDAEAVLIGGNGFRAARAIEALEERTGRPVLESNQVLLWSILAKLDADVHLAGFGRLLGEAAPREGARTTLSP